MEKGGKRPIKRIVITIFMTIKREERKQHLRIMKLTFTEKNVSQPKMVNSPENETEKRNSFLSFLKFAKKHQ